MDTGAVLRCRPAGQDRAALRDAFARCTHERTQVEARLAALMERRRRIVLTGTPVDLVNSAIAIQSVRETVELLDVAFAALAECDRNIAAGA